MSNAHIVKSFDDELSHIESLILEMGGLVETQIHEAAEALVSRDLDLAAKVRKDDKTVDSLETQHRRIDIANPCPAPADGGGFAPRHQRLEDCCQS